MLFNCDNQFQDSNRYRPLKHETEKSNMIYNWRRYNLYVQVLCDCVQIIHNDESMILSLLAICIYKFQKYHPARKHFIDVHVQPQGTSMRFKVQLASVLGAEQEQPLQIPQREMQIRDILFRQMCQKILDQIGPKEQEIEISKTNDTVTFSIYNICKSHSEEDVEENADDMRKNIPNEIISFRDINEIAYERQTCEAVPCIHINPSIQDINKKLNLKDILVQKDLIPKIIEKQQFSIQSSRLILESHQEPIKIQQPLSNSQYSALNFRNKNSYQNNIIENQNLPRADGLSNASQECLKKKQIYRSSLDFHQLNGSQHLRAVGSSTPQIAQKKHNHSSMNSIMRNALMEDSFFDNDLSQNQNSEVFKFCATHK